MKRSFRVDKSKIHGRGLFAERDFKKGDVVFIFKGQIYKRDNKTKKDTFANPDSIGIGKNMWIDPVGDYHFINHSCDPNLGIKGKVVFCALRNIKKNEELTFDYSMNEADQKWFMSCKCGSKKCRKLIRSIQFLPKKTYQHYFPYIPKYFAQVYNKSVK